MELSGDSSGSPVPGQKKSVNEVIAGDMPTMSPPEEGATRLPRGILLDGEWQTDVKVRELTGADEEVLARRQNAIDYFDSVINLGVESVGKIDLTGKPPSEREHLLGTLLVGEREMVFLTVIRATFGNERDIEYTCSACQTRLATTLLLDHDIVLKDTLGIDPPTSYEFTTSKGEVVEYRLTNGLDQREALGKSGATQAEQNTIILTNVIRTVDGKSIPDRRRFVLSMSMKDRRDFVSVLDEKQPKMENELDIACTTCGEPQKIAIDWGSLFRP